MHVDSVQELDKKIMGALEDSSWQWFSIQGLTHEINKEVNEKRRLLSGMQKESEEPPKDYCSPENVGLRCGVLLMEGKIRLSSVIHYNDSPEFMVQYK